MSDGPPRGIRQSIESRWLHELDRRLPAWCPRPGPTQSAGSPALANASRSTPAMAMLDSMAPDEPRRNAALPDLRQSPAASLVTLGRFS